MKSIDMVYDVLSFRWQPGLAIALSVQRKYAQSVVGKLHFLCDDLVKQGLAEAMRGQDGKMQYRRTTVGKPVSPLSQTAVATIAVCDL